MLSASAQHPALPPLPPQVVSRLASVLPPLIPCLFVKDASKIIRCPARPTMCMGGGRRPAWPLRVGSATGHMLTVLGPAWGWYWVCVACGVVSTAVVCDGLWIVCGVLCSVCTIANFAERGRQCQPPVLGTASLTPPVHLPPLPDGVRRPRHGLARALRPPL